jgi:hypothetical protein
LDIEIKELAALIAQEKSLRDEMPKICSLLLTGREYFKTYIKGVSKVLLSNLQLFLCLIAFA